MFAKMQPDRNDPIQCGLRIKLRKFEPGFWQSVASFFEFRRRSEFKSHSSSLQFFCKMFATNENKQKEAIIGPF